MTAVRARLMRRLPSTLYALLLGGAALLGGCSASNNIHYGTAVVTLSDTNGDFDSYIVSVDAITLTRTDGVPAYPLTTPQWVDLVKVHDLNELVDAPAIPEGTYTTLSLTLDYTAATVMVDVNGVPTAAKTVDATGNPASITSLTVTFDPKNQLVITSGQCTRLAIDINLAAANSVDLSTSTPTVTVRPFVTATVAPADQTVLRARGILVVAQPSSSDYVVNMRPFIDPLSALGALTVKTTSSTYFNIDGVEYTGAAGLTAMQSLLVSTPIEAYGTLGSFSTITPGFNATAVYAGTSLENPVADYLTGTVSAVSGNTLTLHSATLSPRVGATLLPIYYYPNMPVTVGPATGVSEDGGAASALSAHAISVGQRITVSGEGSYNSTTNVLTSLDATGTASGAPPGQVRLRATSVWGTLNTGASGSMSLNVASLGNFAPGALNFTGTGSTPANNAVATSYAVSTPGIDESATPAGTLLEAVGLVTPFGSAPPDFTASAVTPGAATPQTLVVDWGTAGTASPFSSASSAGLVVDLSNAHLSTTNPPYIATGPTRTNLSTLTASPTIAFATGGTLTFAVGPLAVSGGASTIQVFNTASGFATALAAALNGTNLVYHLVCVGQYSIMSNTFTATQVAVNL